MRKIIILLMTVMPLATSAQIFWTEDFNTACVGSNCLASSFVGTNGAWTETLTGTNATDQNHWYVSCQENGECFGFNASFSCVTGCGGVNATLHIGRGSTFSGDTRAGYYNGNIGGVFGETHKRIESPTIDCSGKTNVRANFLFVGYGDNCGNDFASMLYSPNGGTTWQILDVCFISNCIGSCTGSNGGVWDSAWVQLPASAADNPNVKIAFDWQNDDDGTGIELSFAVNDLDLHGTDIVADFSVSDSAICLGDSVDLSDLSTGPPSSWSWSFTPNTVTYLNGTGATSQNPRIQFDSAGTYNISLTAGGDNETKNAVVVVHPNPAAVAGSDASVCDGDTVQLMATGGGSYVWTPATGLSNDSVANPMAYPSMPTTYTVVVTDSNGCVSPPDSMHLNINPNPVAGFTANNTTPTEKKDTVQFTSTASGAATHMWTFGDGGSSAAQDPTHVYDTSGSYTVKLVVSSDSGCVDSVVGVNYIDVAPDTGGPPSFIPSLHTDKHILKVQPNPVNGNGKILYYQPDAGEITLTVYDSRSQEVMKLFSGKRRKGNYRHKLSLDDLNPGIYFVVLQTDTAKVTRKMVVIK